MGKDAGLIPVFEDITLRDVRIYGGGKVTLDGYSWENRLKMTFDNVYGDVAGGVRVMASACAADKAARVR